MSMTPTAVADIGLEVSVRPGAFGCAVVAVSGELDLFTDSVLRSALHELITSGCITITLDLTELGFIDTAGLRAVITAADAAEQLGGAVTLGGCSRPVRRFLSLSAGPRLRSLRQLSDLDAGSDPGAGVVPDEPGPDGQRPTTRNSAA